VFFQYAHDARRVARIHLVNSEHQSNRQSLLASERLQQRMFRAAGSFAFIQHGEHVTRSCIPPVWQIAHISRGTSENVDSQTQKSSTYRSSIPYRITGQRVVPVRENALGPGIGFDTHRPYSISIKGNRSALTGGRRTVPSESASRNHKSLRLSGPNVAFHCAEMLRNSAG
jgi:hypothetical protein